MIRQRDTVLTRFCSIKLTGRVYLIKFIKLIIELDSGHKDIWAIVNSGYLLVLLRFQLSLVNAVCALLIPPGRNQSE